jgi:hypothetical protein
MSLKYGLYLPQGFTQELAGIKNPVEAYETRPTWMTFAVSPEHSSREQSQSGTLLAGRN